MKLRIAALALTSLLLTASLPGAVITWDGSTNGDFLTYTNWIGDVVPASGDNVVFVNSPNQTVNLSGPYTLGNMDFNSGGNYSFTGTGSPVLTLHGNLSAFINVDFASSISSIDLSAISHTFAVSTGQSLNFHQGISGSGASLSKDGNGTLTLYGANTYSGTTNVTAGSLYVEGPGASINHGSSNFIIGGPGAGAPTMYINNGANVTNLVGRIGISMGDQGDVAVSGTGSTWTNNGYLYVGEAGVGLLSVTNGGAVSATNTSIGNNGGGHGNVSVTNGTLTNIANLYVGSEGVGALNLYAGSTVTNVDGSVGNNPGGNGMVTISGAGASWTNTGTLYIGATSLGTLNLNNGTVNANSLIVGNAGTGDGSVFLNGANATLAVTGVLRLGNASGSVGYLEANGGATLSSNTGFLGETGGSQGKATIFGTNSTWTLAGDLYVGNGANGKLYVYDGGKVTVGSSTGTLHLGHSTGGVGDLYIGGTGSGYAAGGVINAATILTGSSGGTGTLHLGTTATVISPYALTKTGLYGGAAVAISGPTMVANDAGYNVIKGNNTYTGATDIYSGTLVAFGDTNPFAKPLGNTGTVTVHSGGTLAVYSASIPNPLVLQSGSRLIGNTGSGSISQAIIGAGATLSPGFDYDDPINGPLGSLRFSDLTLDNGGTLEIKVKDSSGSLTNTSVSVVSPSTLHLDATSGNPFTLKLISLDGSYQPGALTGGVTVDVMASLPFLSFQSRSGDLILGDNLLLDTTMFDVGIGSSVNYSVTRSGSLYYVNFTPVPEPSTYALLALGLIGSGFAAWRRKRPSN